MTGSEDARASPEVHGAGAAPEAPEPEGAAEPSTAPPSSTAAGRAESTPPLVPRRRRGAIRKRTLADEGEEEEAGGGEAGRTAPRAPPRASTSGAAGAPPAARARTVFSTRAARPGGEVEAGGGVRSEGLALRERDDATRALETETATDRDARATRERALAHQQRAEAEGPGDGGGGEAGAPLYRGQGAYRDYRAGFRQESIAQDKARGTFGPLRASANVRMSIRVDYQPDVCKDYKETGYCGYGDACKFLHDRGESKPSYVLDREWEESQKKAKRRLEGWDGTLGGGAGGGGRSNGAEGAADEADGASVPARAVPGGVPSSWDSGLAASGLARHARTAGFSRSAPGLGSSSSLAGAGAGRGRPPRR